jgi:uncharacterized protein
MAQELFKRKITDELIKYSKTSDIIVLHGARQVGKTSILQYLQNHLDEEKQKTYFIDLEDARFVDIINSGVDKFLQLLSEEGFEIKKKSNRVYVFIDEIQYLKNPSSFLKLIADHHKNIKLIVSGSSSFGIKNKFKDSLVGRTVNFEIFNLSFEEFLIFKKYQKINLGGVMTVKKEGELLELFKEYILYGGYPKIVLTPEKELKEKYLLQIIDTYIKKDIRDLAEIRDIDKFNKLIETLASQSGQLVSQSELAGTCGLSRPTIEKYLFILENTYIIKLVRPFSKNIRSELFKTPKIFFYDTGLLQMLWLKELPREIIGNVFETAIFSELVKKHGKDSVYFWRTQNKKEIDFVLRIKNEILPIEAKINFEKHNHTAINYFNGAYKIDKYKVVGMSGKRKKENYIFPWQL